MRLIDTLLAGVLLPPLLACGGGGGDESSDPINDALPSTTLAIEFVADADPAEDGTVWLESSEATGDLVTVKANVTGVSDIFAVGFDLDFDSTAVEFLNWSPGNLLEKNGRVPIYQILVQQGKIVVGASRTADAPGADVVGTRNLIHLTFRGLKPGSSGASFDNATLLRPGAIAPEPIPDTNWVGGQFKAN